MGPGGRYNGRANVETDYRYSGYIAVAENDGQGNFGEAVQIGKWYCAVFLISASNACMHEWSRELLVLGVCMGMCCVKVYFCIYIYICVCVCVCACVRNFPFPTPVNVQHIFINVLATYTHPTGIGRLTLVPSEAQ